LIPLTRISARPVASNVPVLLKSLYSFAVVAAIVVVTIVGFMAREICHRDVTRLSSMVGLLPLRIRHVQAELGESYGGSTKNVAINHPSPEKHMFLLLSDGLNVTEGYRGPQTVITLFWAENEFVPFGLRESIEISVFVGNCILKCHGHFISTVFRRSGSAIAHSQVKPITSDCLAPDFLDTELSVFMRQLRVQGAAGEPEPA